jgi:hypothetical protein
MSCLRTTCGPTDHRAVGSKACFVQKHAASRDLSSLSQPNGCCNGVFWPTEVAIEKIVVLVRRPAGILQTSPVMRRWLVSTTPSRWPSCTAPFDRALEPDQHGAAAGKGRADIDPAELWLAIARLCAPNDRGGISEQSRRMVALLVDGLRYQRRVGA